MSLSLDLRFTDPAAPLFINVEGDNTETLFVISTSQVHGAIAGAPSQHYHTSSNESKKRVREETPAEPRNKKPMKVVQRVDPRVSSVSLSPGPDLRQRSITPQACFQTSQQEMPPPSFIPPHPPPFPQIVAKEPLFLPSSSQLSVIDEAILRSTGLGVENMDVDELTDMLEGEGEEVAFDFVSQDPNYHKFLERPGHGEEEDSPDSFELVDDIAEIPPTQALGEPRVSRL